MSAASELTGLDLPRERLRERGVSSLDDAELIAVLIGTGYRGRNVMDVSRNVLQRIGGIRGFTAQGIGSLAAHSGLGEAKSARLLAGVELGVRVAGTVCGRPGRFHCSGDIYERYRARLGLLRQEVFLVVGLNTKNEVMREQVVAMGSVDECRVNPREVFRPLIAEACARMVVLHNHPSGDCSPSSEDIALTRRLQDAGTLMGIPLLDHLVIGAGAYCSLRDMGILKET